MASPEAFADKPVTLAAVTGAHGVTGEVRLKLFGEGVESLRRFRAFAVDGQDRVLSLKKVRSDNKGGAVARFAEITDRNAAEALRGSVLTVARSELPDLSEGEYYYADFIGLAAVSDSGEPLGVVVGVENFGASDILEIERPTQDGKKPKRFMVPLTAAAVPEWDESRVVIAAGFAGEP